MTAYWRRLDVVKVITRSPFAVHAPAYALSEVLDSFSILRDGGFERTTHTLINLHLDAEAKATVAIGCPEA